MSEELIGSLVEAILAARAAMGDSGRLTMNVYSNAEDYIAAFTLTNRRDPIRLREMISNGLRFEAGYNNIWLYGPNLSRGPAVAISMYHEYYHVLQKAYAQRPLFLPNDLPWWLGEGSAEYFGYRAAADAGLVDFDRFRQQIVSRSKAAQDQPISSLESSGGSGAVGQSGEAVAIGFLATEYLAQTHGEEKIRQRIYEAMRGSVDWKTAFASALGVPVPQFYDEFESYRRSL